ncbi:MAG: flagellar protein FlbD [Lachnospiraceae bacterium]|nr:flagellar protein FlbD [Lachnospiraceae bacterium]MCR5082479.1 flagellar FlbD family protein [Parasporobacterium sp.]
MITVTRLNGKELMINPDMIQHIEDTPDTVITLSDTKKFVVSEKSEEIRRKIIEFKKEIYSGR